MDNPLVNFLRSYGPSAASDALYDELVRGEIERLGVDEIVIPSPLVDEVGQILTGADPVNVVLTGTAGDGKTYNIRKVFLDFLKGPASAWPGSDVLVTHTLPNGRELRIIRDLSEVPAARKAEEIGRITNALLGHDTSAVYLVAANDGQLLKLWRDAADGGGTDAERHRQVYDILSEMMLHEVEKDPTGKLGLRLFNLSRRLTGTTLDSVIDAILDHPGWETGCSGCQIAADAERPCPIRLNRALLHGGVDGRSDRLFRTRLRELFEVASANDKHVPLRQVLALVVNVVLGDAKDPDVPLLTCGEARKRAQENAYSLTNPYDNAVGGNLRSERRQNNSMFAVLDAFGLGQETNNAVDDLLLHGRPEPVRAAVNDPDPHYGERLFETQRNAYVRGGPQGFNRAEFHKAIDAQRRRLFFRLPTNGIEPAAPGLAPWVLTVFHHGGAYLRFREAVRTGGDQAAVKSATRDLIRGLNRTLTGMMSDDSDQLWLAGTLGRTDDPTGRIVTVDPIPLAGGHSFLHVAVSHDKSRRRPRLSVQTSLKGMQLPEMPALDLRPILFEYLVRVAHGSLPSSFSRQCHQETRRFATLLTQHVLRFVNGGSSSAATSLGLLHITEAGKIQREGIEVSAS
ncbi:hypothetical protein [uncultured Methylobacterium sp.]|uniref:hypothetical protein n=1 Tax=uncultured Methylobacterium sp. TaxID=157278 RepID=UPI002591EEFE|nr:hypothetical protein [uncultured Methylobacterium sp.]